MDTGKYHALSWWFLHPCRIISYLYITVASFILNVTIHPISHIDPMETSEWFIFVDICVCLAVLVNIGECNPPSILNKMFCPWVLFPLIILVVDHTLFRWVDTAMKFPRSSWIRSCGIFLFYLFSIFCYWRSIDISTYKCIFIAIVAGLFMCTVLFFYYITCLSFVISSIEVPCCFSIPSLIILPWPPSCYQNFSSCMFLMRAGCWCRISVINSNSCCYISSLSNTMATIVFAYCTVHMVALYCCISLLQASLQPQPLGCIIWLAKLGSGLPADKLFCIGCQWNLNPLLM